MARILIIIILLISYSAMGQHSVGIKLGGGVSKVGLRFPGGWVNSTAIKRLGPYIEGGYYYNEFFGKKSMFGFEFILARLTGNEETRIISTNSSGASNELGVVQLNHRLSYFLLPLYYGVKFRKMTFIFGAQAGVVLSAIVKQESSEVYILFDRYRNPLDRYDVGARVGVLYQATRRFGLEATYYYRQIMCHTKPLVIAGGGRSSL